jgi:hypothetical protein
MGYKYEGTGEGPNAAKVKEVIKRGTKYESRN